MHVKGVGLEGKRRKQEEVIAGGNHGEPYLLNLEPRCCLEGMKENEIILVFEKEQDKIKFPGDEMKRQVWRQAERCTQGCEYGGMDLAKHDGGGGRNE